MTALALSGFGPLYTRRLAIAVRTASGMIGQITTPILWVLVVAPALNTALGNFRPDVDYFTYVAVAQVAKQLPSPFSVPGANFESSKIPSRECASGLFWMTYPSFQFVA